MAKERGHLSKDVEEARSGIAREELYRWREQTRREGILGGTCQGRARRTE